MITVKAPIEIEAKQYFMKVIPVKIFPLGSAIRENKAQMLGERAFRIIMNALYVVALYKILLQQDCDFLD